MEERQTDSEGMTAAGSETQYERTAGTESTPAKSNGDRPAGLLNRDAMLKIARKPREPKKVELPWLGSDAHVFVMPMTARDKDEFEKSLVKGKGRKRVVTEDNIRARIISRCTVNADGSRMFTDRDVDDLGNLDGQTADAIFTIAATESGITDEDVEDLAKN